MIEIGDGRSIVEATDRVSGSQPRQAAADWVKQVAQPQRTISDADDMLGTVQLIDGERSLAQALSIQGAFAVWSELCGRSDSEPAAPATVRAAAKVLAGLIGNANKHAQDLFAEVKTGVGSAFFA